MHDDVQAQVRLEIEQIDHLLDVYRDLLAGAQANTPDAVQIAALASVLHSFYNGVENIFLSVAKRMDQRIPEGSHWHVDLLDQMARPGSSRPNVITEPTTLALTDFLGFRHFYRHSYSHILKWEKIEGLVLELDVVWTRLKVELRAFLHNLG